MRPMALMWLRMGIVLLALAVLVRPLPMPSEADVLVDDMAIAASLVLVGVTAAYLRLSRSS
jgi:hypothetical protein